MLAKQSWACNNGQKGWQIHCDRSWLSKNCHRIQAFYILDMLPLHPCTPASNPICEILQAEKWLWVKKILQLYLLSRGDLPEARMICKKFGCDPWKTIRIISPICKKIVFIRHCGYLTNVHHNYIGCALSLSAIHQ